MSQDFVRVCPEDFDVAALIALAREGKLFVKRSITTEPSAEMMMRRCRKEALTYVAAIDDYAAVHVRPHINKVWEQIIMDKAFVQDLIMKKGRLRGRLNRYFVTSLVANLQARGIYIPAEEVSLLKLHLAMEKTTEKNSIYKNRARYPLKATQRKRLSMLIDCILTSLK